MPDIVSNRKDALVSSAGRISFDELERRVNAEAARLTADRPEEPWILIWDRSFDFVIRFLAALRSKVVVAIFAPEWTAVESEKRRTLLERHRDGLDPQTAVILFTSGSSGEAKAVQLSSSGIDANIDAVLRCLEFSRAEEQTLFLPLSYSFGLLGQLLPALRSGMTTHFLPDFLGVKSLLESSPERVRGMWSGVASHWSAVLRLARDLGPFPQVTHVISAGARLDPMTKSGLRGLFPNAILYNNYGQTEASPRILSISSADPRFFEDTTGYAVDRIEVRLSAEGELEARGPQVMRGYLGDPQGTTEKIGDGWLKTGDLAMIDASGLVSIRGRTDDLVKIGGERVSPHELEAAVQATGWAAEVCVVPIADELYGSRFVLFLGEVASDAPKDALLVKSLRESLAPAKLPSKVVRLDRLPRTTNGKFDRQKMQSSLKEKSP